MTRTLIETRHGHMVDLHDPDPATIHLEDIAWALANTQRFGGHLPVRWSVADHSVLCRDLADEHGRGDLALAALLHDAAEAYLGDLPTPLKHALGDNHAYRQLERRMRTAISHALHVNPATLHDPFVVQIDRAALHLEGRAFQTHAGRTLITPAPTEITLEPRPLLGSTVHDGATQFIDNYRQLRAPARSAA